MEQSNGFRLFRLGAVALLAGALAMPALAIEYRSTTGPTILYDAPSVKATKLFVVGPGYPVELIVTVSGMHKVRDMSGTLAWVEQRALSEARTVVVRASVADVLAAPEDKSPLVFKAEQNVLLDLLEPPANAWVKVRHRDGQVGYVRISQVWGL